MSGRKNGNAPGDLSSGLADVQRVPRMTDSINESRIRYLYESSRCGTVRAAAEHLGVAPSAVSRQIALLEDELGIVLVERHKRGVRPTEAGFCSSSITASNVPTRQT